MMSVDEVTVFKKGITFVDETMEPRLTAKTKDLLERFPRDIELYEGDEEGYDIKGSRAKKAKMENEFNAKVAENTKKVLASEAAPQEQEEEMDEPEEQEPEEQKEEEEKPTPRKRKARKRK